MKRNKVDKHFSDIAGGGAETQRRLVQERLHFAARNQRLHAQLMRKLQKLGERSEQAGVLGLKHVF
jgi:hypothetical protein